MAQPGAIAAGLPEKVDLTLCGAIQGSVALLTQRFARDVAQGRLTADKRPEFLAHYVAPLMMEVMAKAGISRNALQERIDLAIADIPSSVLGNPE